MKFELTNSREKYSDIDYLNDLRKVANNLNKKSLKMRDYSKKNGSQFSITSISNRFGNWDNVLKKAGLEGEKSLKGMEYGEKKIKDEVLIADLKRVASKLNKSNISISEYNKNGEFTNVTLSERFGSWNNAKEKADLQITVAPNNTNEDLFQNILQLWELLGRQPKYGEIISPNSKYNGSTYARRFGSWGKTLENFIEYVNSAKDIYEYQNETINLIPINENNEVSKIINKKAKKTTRNINLRLRFQILKRDNFSCKKCGQSPAKNPAINLHIDHIIPWSKDGETVIENLETLCEQCNLGKSNLI